MTVQELKQEVSKAPVQRRAITNRETLNEAYTTLDRVPSRAA